MEKGVRVMWDSISESPGWKKNVSPWNERRIYRCESMKWRDGKMSSWLAPIIRCQSGPPLTVASWHHYWHLYIIRCSPVGWVNVVGEPADLQGAPYFFQMRKTRRTNESRGASPAPVGLPTLRGWWGANHDATSSLMHILQHLYKLYASFISTRL